MDPGGRLFLFLTERDGWRHAYVHSREGREERLLTPGPSDVMERGPVDEREGWLYFFASPDDATQRYLHRVRLDGSEAPERVTPEGQPGTPLLRLLSRPSVGLPHPLQLRHASGDRAGQPPGPPRRPGPEDNAEVRRRAEAAISHPAEFLELDIGDGVVMDAWMIKPRDFDPARRYPVFIYVYGEPHAQTVLDRWSTRNIYHRAIADLGYLVVSIENRGTPAPKGGVAAGALSDDRRGVDGGTCGGSAGDGPDAPLRGSVQSGDLGMERRRIEHPEFPVPEAPTCTTWGSPWSPSPSPHLYNAWFQEIYMETLETNPEGYRVSAPINYAEGLEGDLLIIHGTGETNTHLEIVEGLVDRLVELGKTFDYMTVPEPEPRVVGGGWDGGASADADGAVPAGASAGGGAIGRAVPTSARTYLIRLLVPAFGFGGRKS